ncbi:hypothetical protein ACFQ05_06960 [Amycolatopsis umgeniensis]|uniref:Uncharacterized protein n=1 Tax=Amycolatopsis umgeniensis TaxID=336628 RepID=A0A841AVU5_9PSEU|nr:hypothetical protein [Amycolatopsis umgeniensis]MBB5853019.1 hypothetical protein [Amycolatopsis umgeniensis]
MSEDQDATVIELPQSEWYGVPPELLDEGAVYDWDSPGGCG